MGNAPDWSSLFRSPARVRDPEFVASASPNDLREAEARFGGALPEVLLEIYRVQDGGHLRKSGLDRDGKWSEAVPGEYLYPSNKLRTLESEYRLADWDDEGERAFSRFANRERVVILAKHAFSHYLLIDFTRDANPDRIPVEWLDVYAAERTDLAENARAFFENLKGEP